MPLTSSSLRRAPASFIFGAVVRPPRFMGEPFGWFANALALWIGLCVPAVLNSSGWLIAGGLLWPVAILALLAGRILAGARWPGPLQLPLGIGAGLCGIVIAMARPVAQLSASPMSNSAARFPGTAAASLWQAVIVGSRQEADAVRQFLHTLVAWFGPGGTGNPVVDQHVLLFLLAGLTWTTVFTFAWTAFRRTPALLAVLPPGVVVVTGAVLSSHGALAVYAFLGAAPLLIARLHTLSLRRSWRLRRLREAPRSLAGPLGLAIAIMTLAGLMAVKLPAAPKNGIATTFWNSATPTWTQLQNRATAAFLRSGTVGANNGSGLTLGGSLTPAADRPIMEISIDQGAGGIPTQGGLQYFLGAAYAGYTGKGWQVSPSTVSSRTGVPLLPNGQPDYVGVATSGGKIQTLPAGQALAPAIPSAPQVTQHVQLLTSSADHLVYAYNQAFTINRPVIVRRAGAAIAQVDLQQPTASYTVVSQIPNVRVAALRSAGQAYPAGLAPYLAPPQTTARVAQLARAWAAGAGNPYDMAVAIQTRLRRFPYTLDVPAPPPGQDPVDYFLFSAQRGYCEYYASAMVVMLRELGVPARVATGYATNTFDTSRQAYVITENDAHAWVQVYFPGAGWINFEPTPANPSLLPASLPGASLAFQPALPAPGNALPVGGTPAPAAVPWFPGALVVVFALAALLLLALWRRPWMRLSPTAQVRRLYARMLRLSWVLGVAKRPSETPLEFVDRLAVSLDRATGVAARRLTAIYVRQQYGGAALAARDCRLASRAWSAVWNGLWRAFWRRMFNRRLSAA